MSKVFAAALALALTGVIPVAAQSIGTTHIPFAFYVGDTKLPAGSYEVQAVREQVMRIINISTKNVAAAFSPIAITRANTSLQTSGLVFNRYGDEYFLSEMWPAGTSSGRMLPRSDLEIRLAKKVPPIRIESLSVVHR